MWKMSHSGYLIYLFIAGLLDIKLLSTGAEKIQSVFSTKLKYCSALLKI